MLRVLRLQVQVTFLWNIGIENVKKREKLFTTVFQSRGFGSDVPGLREKITDNWILFIFLTVF